jgi:hypothetical protein
MKKIITFGLMALATVTSMFTANAQSSASYSTSGFGIKGGLGFSTIHYKDAEDRYENLDNKITPAANVDFTYEHRFGKVFAIEPGVSFQLKGGSREVNIPLTSRTLKMNTHYQTIDIPVNAKFYLGDNFSLYAGPFVSFTTAAWANIKTFNGEGTKVDDFNSVNLMKDKYADDNDNKVMSRVDAGVLAGLEYTTDRGVIVGAKYTQGLTDISNDSYKGYVGSDALILAGDNKFVRNNQFAAYVGFRF